MRPPPNSAGPDRAAGPDAVAPAVAGPDADAEVIVAAYRGALPPGAVEEFPATALDRVGVPAWTVQATGAGPAFGGFGYGATDGEARVGAHGEIAEEARSWAALQAASRRVASYAELRAERGPDGVQDPRTLGLPAGTGYDPDRPLHWLPTTRNRDGATVLVPAEFVASAPHDLDGGPPPGGWLALPVTNGLGAGLDPDRALAHALLEVVQRDGNGLAFRALDRGVVLDLDGVTDPVTRDVLARLRAAGVDVVAKLAGTDFGIPNVYVVGAADDDDVLAASACGEAAHPDREQALRKALLKFTAARARKRFMFGPLPALARVAPPDYLDRTLPTVHPEAEEPRVLAAMLAWLTGDPAALRARLDATVLTRRTTARFGDLPTAATPDAAARCRLVLDRLAADGFDVLVADLSGDGVSVVKALVPGLEVETVAYGRIGERNVARLRDGGRDDLAWVGSPRPGALRVALTPEAEERLGGPAWLDRGAVDRAVGDLLPLYREPGRHAAPVALGDRETPTGVGGGAA